jgi:hypothetical protein
MFISVVLLEHLEDHLHDIHNYVRQHLKLASDWMKTRYDKLANSTQVTKRVTGCSSIAQPAQRGNLQSFSLRGKAHTR